MFDLPLKKKRDGNFRLQQKGDVFTCGTSDFFLEEADEWRTEAWSMIRQRQDLSFLIITKRIHRFYEKLPPDWGEGYPNVKIGCTVAVSYTHLDIPELPVFPPGIDPEPDVSAPEAADGASAEFSVWVPSAVAGNTASNVSVFPSDSPLTTIFCTCAPETFTCASFSKW